MMGDLSWEEWLIEVNNILRDHDVENIARVLTSHYSHVRYSFERGFSYKEVAYWLLERNSKYEVLESIADEKGKPTCDGKVIAVDLTENAANMMLDRLFSVEKVWWKRKCKNLWSL